MILEEIAFGGASWKAGAECKIMNIIRMRR